MDPTQKIRLDDLRLRVRNGMITFTNEFEKIVEDVNNDLEVRKAFLDLQADHLIRISTKITEVFDDFKSIQVSDDANPEWGNKVGELNEMLKSCMVTSDILNRKKTAAEQQSDKASIFESQVMSSGKTPEPDLQLGKQKFQTAKKRRQPFSATTAESRHASLKINEKKNPSIVISTGNYASSSTTNLLSSQLKTAIPTATEKASDVIGNLVPDEFKELISFDALNNATRIVFTRSNGSANVMNTEDRLSHDPTLMSIEKSSMVVPISNRDTQNRDDASRESLFSDHGTTEDMELFGDLDFNVETLLE